MSAHCHSECNEESSQLRRSFTAFRMTVILCLITCALLLVTTPVHAADTPRDVTSGNYQAPQHSDYTIQNLMGSALCQMIGWNPTSVNGCLVTTVDSNGQNKLVLYNKVPGGAAIGGLSSVLAAVYTPPTSSVEYLADLGRNFGIVQPAYAQVAGSGAGIISPILSLWKAVRNVAFMGFIVIFLVIGFMIMFRQKLNPQTVISAQNALPGIVIGLLLVYFSYFASALLVDTAFVGIPLIGQVFAENITEAPNAFGKTVPELQDVAKSNIFMLFFKSAPWVGSGTRTSSEINSAANSILDNSIGQFWGRSLSAVALGLAGFFSGGFSVLGLALGGAGAVAGLAGPEILGLLVPIVLIIALMIQCFRLLFKLISAYISILVFTVFAPLIIMFSSIPGRGGVLSLWWKTLLANALVFPAVFAGFLFAGMILGSKPEAWAAAPPLFGGLVTELLRLIIAYGVILGTPAIPDMVKAAMGVKDIQGIPQAAMAGITGGASLGKAAASRFVSPYQRDIEAYNKARIEHVMQNWGNQGGANHPDWWIRLFGKH